jgi:uncharacterized membrane protein
MTDGISPPPTATSSPKSRRGYIDWLRGLAILVMIEAHVVDAWTRPTDRNTDLFGYLKVLGGFAAPLFLFLAGVAVVFAARARFTRTNDVAAASRAVQRRGWEIFALAFLFRFQAWLLNPAASPAQMLKVDILNIMGPAIVVAALLWGLVPDRRGRLVIFALATAVMTLATPPVREASWLGVLPGPIEAYFRPVPGRNNFMLFPWAGFVFAGSFVGMLLDRVRSRSEDFVFHGWLGLAGLACAFGSYYAWYLPSPYAHSEFWTSSPSFFFMRVGILVVAVGVIFFQQAAAPLTALGRAKPMQRFGRSSLFVYWIHVEMVYGAVSMSLQHKLSVRNAVIAFAVFSLMMFALVVLKDRVKDRWRLRKVRAVIPVAQGFSPAREGQD